MPKKSLLYFVRLIIQLAKRLGGRVSGLSQQQYEDLLLGQLMDKAKTGETVPRSSILEKLK
ncbi:MAG: hypothetical protein U1C46_07860 [Bacteroidales bacterium]|nr:hypothetical protein [Bacteroidales bacterium]MDZ4204720.1 hypothetical protein [Bacteroidales bacterium]